MNVIVRLFDDLSTDEILIFTFSLKCDSSSEGSSSALSMSDFLYQQRQMHQRDDDPLLFCKSYILYKYYYVNYIFILWTNWAKCHDNWRRLRFRPNGRLPAVGADCSVGADWGFDYTGWEGIYEGYPIPLSPIYVFSSSISYNTNLWDGTLSGL